MLEKISKSTNLLPKEKIKIKKYWLPVIGEEQIFHLIHLIFARGGYPSIFKIAIVRPIYKKIKIIKSPIDKNNWEGCKEKMDFLGIN